MGIYILVYSCIWSGTSKIYLCLKDNTSPFSQVSLKSETKDMHPSTTVLSCLFFRKQRFDVIRQLKMSNFICGVKQLKMNKFIKSIWELVPRMLYLRYTHYNHAECKMRKLWPQIFSGKSSTLRCWKKQTLAFAIYILLRVYMKCMGSG